MSYEKMTGYSSIFQAKTTSKELTFIFGLTGNSLTQPAASEQAIYNFIPLIPTLISEQFEGEEIAGPISCSRFEIEGAIFVQLDNETIFDNRSLLVLKLIPELELKLV